MSCRSRDMTDDTLPSDESSFAVHDVHDVTGKEALVTDCYTGKPPWGVNKKIKHTSLSVVRS